MKYRRRFKLAKLNDHTNVHNLTNIKEFLFQILYPQRLVNLPFTTLN